jgi:transforming growth factor-beta-induced protein
MKKLFFTFLSLSFLFLGTVKADTVVDVIVNSPDHTTLETAVIAAELDDDLSGAGPFTVFAPTDDAFAALGSLVTDLLQDPTGELAEILLYHVVSGNILSTDLTEGSVPTLNGKEVSVSFDNGSVMINNATVTFANIETDNGVVHVIDAVMVPPVVTVVDVVINSPDHQTLEAAVVAAGLADDLTTDGPFTVFAPTDAAFAALGTVVDDLLLDPTGELADILLYHVVSGEVLSTDLTAGDVQTLNGKNITVSFDGTDVLINGAKVTTADIETDNGVVHVIDAVMIPPVVTVVDVVINSPDHQTLEAAVVAAGLADDLTTDGPFTVFAPTDAAFAALGTVVDDLLLDPTGELADILLYHVVSGEVLSTDLTAGDVQTLNGKNITVSFDGTDVLINGAKVTTADIETDNGVVHVIDAVMIPPVVTVVDVVINSPDHQTLEAAVIAAELADDLTTDGPFTVFAPTDAAFAALGTVVDDLLQDPTGELADILLYHVVSGEVLSTDLTAGDVPTLNGKNVTVSFDGDDVFINGAKVTTADIQTDNGVVHVIDAVMIPPVITVVDIVVNSPDHETLEAAVIAAELADDLTTDGPFTVFAPTDAAFAALGTVVDDLLQDPTGELADILLYHVVSGEVLSTDLTAGDVPTLNGKNVTVSFDGDDVFINGAKVTTADIQTDNGVVHVIDAVMIPPVVTVVDIVVNSPDHTILETAVVAAELADDLTGEGPFTVFAPTDDAFAALGTVVDDLLQDPTGQLAQILLYHVVSGSVLSTDLTEGNVPTLNGQDITVSFEGTDILINNAKVTAANIETDNGIVHVIDAVLLPPTNTVDLKDLGISVFPNPASDIISLRGLDGNNIQKITISNNLGQVVKTISNPTNDYINVTDLKGGYYILTLESLDFVGSTRVLIK